MYWSGEGGRGGEAEEAVGERYGVVEGVEVSRSDVGSRLDGKVVQSKLAQAAFVAWKRFGQWWRRLLEEGERLGRGGKQATDDSLGCRGEG